MALTTCCGCLDLRRGSLAVGIFYVLVSLIGVLLCITSLAIGPELLVGPLLLNNIDRSSEAVQLLCYKISLGGLIVSVLVLVISSLLVHGVQVNNTCMVLTWLVVQGLVLVISTIGYVHQVITSISSGAALSITLSALLLVWVAVQCYWYMVVVHHYRGSMRTWSVSRVSKNRAMTRGYAGRSGAVPGAWGVSHGGGGRWEGCGGDGGGGGGGGCSGGGGGCEGGGGGGADGGGGGC